MLRDYFTHCLLLILCCQQLFAAEFAGDATGGTTSAPHRRGIMDNINEGIRYAGQMFGINTAADVANLVAKAFSSATTTKSSSTRPDLLSMFQTRLSQSDQPQPSRRPQKEQDYNYSQEQYESASQQNAGSTSAPHTAEPGFGLDLNAGQLLSNLLRVVGFDASKLGALAINAIVMIAQAIGNAVLSTRQPLKGNAANDGPEALYESDQNAHQPRSLRDGTPIDWFLANPTARMLKLLREMADSKLPDKITEIIEQIEAEKGVRGQAGCLKMLVCKSAPFIWGMQQSLAKRMNFPGNYTEPADDEEVDSRPFSTSVFFKHLPSLAEYRQHGAQCEKRFAQACDLSDLYPPRS